MRLLVAGICLFIALPLFGQSKKELQAEVDKLKSEITELKKPKEINLDDTDIKASYCLGILLASNMKMQGADSIDSEAIAFGMKDVLANNELKLSKEEAGMIVQQYMQEAMEKKSAKLKDENFNFLEENKKKEGVTVTASGLQYEIITKGSGKMPTTEDQVTVHYTGKLIDGTIFDSSVERNEPATFGVNEIISGWTEALQLMREGDKWILYIPYDIGYGERGAGGQIPPYATLIFEVELIKVN